MKKLNSIGVEASPHKRKSEIIICTEQTRFCMKKFIRTRVDQGDICINCLKALELLEEHPIPVSKVKRNLWN